MLFYESTFNNMKDMFNEKPIEIVETTGLRAGMVAKFHKGYVKIYRCPREEVVIEKYYYHDPYPISSVTVNKNYLRNYLNDLRW